MLVCQRAGVNLFSIVHSTTPPPREFRFCDRLSCVSFAFHRLACCVWCSKKGRRLHRPLRPKRAMSSSPQMRICSHCTELKPAASAGSHCILGQWMCSRRCGHAAGDRTLCVSCRDCGCTRYAKKRRLLRARIDAKCASWSNSSKIIASTNSCGSA